MSTVKKIIRRWRTVRKILILIKSVRWTIYFFRHSGVLKNSYDRENFRARIRKEAHGIEKGLALPFVRPFFGQKKITKLELDLEVSEHDPSLSCDIHIAREVLRSYVDWHAQEGLDAALIDSIRKKLPDSDVSSKRGGVIEYNCDFTDEERLSLDNVLLTRRSVRNYSSKIVPFDIITDAIKVAWSSPSVCNRQPWGVAVVQSPEVIQKLLSLQSGNSGFDQSISNLLVVFANTKAFVEDYELFEPFVDAGIFSNALVVALHARNIASCCLNLCVSHKIASKITSEAAVPSHYFPIMMISIGYAVDDCKVAMSTRGESVIFRR